MGGWFTYRSISDYKHFQTLTLYKLFYFFYGVTHVRLILVSNLCYRNCTTPCLDIPVTPFCNIRVRYFYAWLIYL